MISASGLRSLKQRPMPRDRPAGADGDDDRVDLAAGLLPDLGRRDVVVGCGFAMFEYWSGLKPPGISSASREETE